MSFDGLACVTTLRRKIKDSNRSLWSRLCKWLKVGSPDSTLRPSSCQRPKWQVKDLPHCCLADLWGRSVTCRYSGLFPFNPAPPEARLL